MNHSANGDHTELRVEARFCGPSDSANGGYISGLLAAHLGGSSRVTLRSPPPLERKLTIASMGDTGVTLAVGGMTVAEAERVHFTPHVPAPISFEEAMAGADEYRWKTGHPYPSCFVCGIGRGGDALRIFAGPVPGHNLVAAPWVPDANVCGEDGDVLNEVVWAALDCPSGFGAIMNEEDVEHILLGQFTAAVHRSPHQGEQCVVTGWSRGRQGRKLYGGAAVFSADGELYGTSEAVWIVPRMDQV